MNRRDSAIPLRLAVLGAGPMGLYAALAAVKRGFEVTVFEKGGIGASLLHWGKARFFSPLSMNIPPGLRDDLLPAAALPPDEALLTGPEMVEKVLIPLSRSPLLHGKIRTRTRVLAVGRAGLARQDYPGHPVRHEKPFRLLLEGPEGEYRLETDRVLDATGVQGLPAFTGAGNLPAAGEGALGGRILRDLGRLEALLGGDPVDDPFRGGRVLLLGHGHGAAHALLALAQACHRNPDITVTWVTRSRNRRPFRETPSDPLPGREAVVSAANALAESPPSFLDIRRGASLARLAAAPYPPRNPPRNPVPNSASNQVPLSGFLAELTGPGGASSTAPVACAAVAAFTGYRPDTSFLSGLALDLSPATEGTRGLRAALAGATDCLSVPAVSPDDLESGEPGFHLVGAKSYGRANTFLLRDGIRHLEMILAAAR